MMRNHGLTHILTQRLTALAESGKSCLIVCPNTEKANQTWQGLPPGLPIKVVAITDDLEGSLARQEQIEREQMRRNIIIDDIED